MGLRSFLTEPSRARQLGRQPRHPIHRFPDGKVGRIVGDVGLVEEELIAPFSERRCVAWFARVSGGEAPSSRDPVIEASSVVPFSVDDGSAQAFVLADASALLLPFDFRRLLGGVSKPPASVLRFIRQYRRADQRLKIDFRMSWEEGIIPVGGRVAVVGLGRREVDPEVSARGYRDSGARLVMRQTDEPDSLAVSTFEGALG